MTLAPAFFAMPFHWRGHLALASVQRWRMGRHIN
jgi:hypothetical protein